MNVRQCVLEYATPRAGDIAVVGQALAGRELGLGVVNPRSAAAEEPDAIVARVAAAAKLRSMARVAKAVRERYG